MVFAEAGFVYVLRDVWGIEVLCRQRGWFAARNGLVWRSVVVSKHHLTATNTPKGPMIAPTTAPQQRTRLVRSFDIYIYRSISVIAVLRE